MDFIRLVISLLGISLFLRIFNALNLGVDVYKYFTSKCNINLMYIYFCISRPFQIVNSNKYVLSDAVQTSKHFQRTQHTQTEQITLKVI